MNLFVILYCLYCLLFDKKGLLTIIVGVVLCVVFGGIALLIAGDGTELPIVGSVIVIVAIIVLPFIIVDKIFNKRK